MKKGPLTKIEKFYVEHCNDSVEDIAKALDRSATQIKKVKTVNKKEEAVVDIPFVPNVDNVSNDKPKETSETLLAQSMGRHKRKGQYVATVMTEAASELADAARKDRVKNRGKLRNAIHKPKG